MVPHLICDCVHVECAGFTYYKLVSETFLRVNITKSDDLYRLQPSTHYGSTYCTSIYRKIDLRASRDV